MLVAAGIRFTTKIGSGDHAAEVNVETIRYDQRRDLSHEAPLSRWAAIELCAGAGRAGALHQASARVWFYLGRSGAHCRPFPF